MEVVYTVETVNGKTWTATCADPVLEVEGTDIIAVSKAMALKIEKWFIETFNTTRKVTVEVPVIKAKVKANVSVRAETPLDEFDKKEDKSIGESHEETISTVLTECSNCGMEILVREDEQSPLCQACAYDREVSAQNGVVDDVLTKPPRPALPSPPTRPKVNGPCVYISDGKGILPVGACEAVSSDPSDTPGLKADADGSCQGEFERCKYYKASGMRTSDLAEDDGTYDQEEIDDYSTPGDYAE